MKIFDWVQGKFNGRQGTKKANSISNYNHKQQESRKEEFSDWPHGLLAIGTFGNNVPKQVPETTLDHLHGNTSSSQDQPQDVLTPDEVEKLHNELTSSAELEFTHNLLSDEFIECPSRLEGGQMINVDAFDEDSSNEKNDRLQRGTGNDDVGLDNTKSVINKKSFSFLLKKKFVCRGGFSINPPLRDPLPESKMEKILMAVLHKKTYPQTSSSPTLSQKKYLKDKHMTKSENQDEKNDKESDETKWVKTDSEYIVLEI